MEGRYTRKLLDVLKVYGVEAGSPFLLGAIAFGGRLKAHDFADLSESALITRSFSAASTSLSTMLAR